MRVSNRSFSADSNSTRPPLARLLVIAVLACVWLAPCELVGASPRARNPRQARPAEGERVPVVFIGPRGGVSLDGKAVGTVKRPARLTAALKLILRGRGKSPNSNAVIIKAPAELHYSSVKKVVAAVKRAGADPIRLVTYDEFGDAVRELEAIGTRPRPSDDPTAADPALPTGTLEPSEDPAIPKRSSIVVVIAGDGNLYVGRRLVPEGELEATVRSLTAEIPEAERVVYVSTHLDATYKQVVWVIETIRKAGVNQIGMVVMKRGKN